MIAFYLNYDLDSASYKYGRIDGRHQGFGGIKTTGSSVTIDAVVAGAGPFAPLLVGDYIWIHVGETVYKRKVATKPSNDQITVNTAVNLGTGTAAWYFLPFEIGTTAEDGWQSTEGLTRAWLHFDFATIANAVDVSVEVRGRAPGEAPKPVITLSYVAGTPIFKPLEITELVGSVRVGLKASTTFAGTDDLTVSLKGDGRW